MLLPLPRQLSKLTTEQLQQLWESVSEPQPVGEVDHMRWLPTGGASRGRVQTPRARSLDPAVEARSCAGSGLRGAVSASGPGGQIWWGDLARGPDPSIWPLRRGLTQDLAMPARCVSHV